MKKLIVIGAVLLLTSSAQAVNYTWTGGASDQWDCTSILWNPATIPGGSNTDNVIIGSSGRLWDGADIYTIGQLTHTSGTLGGWNTGGSLTVDSAGGLTGDVVIGSNTSYLSNLTMNVDGNFVIGAGALTGAITELNLYGTSKGYKNSDGGSNQHGVVNVHGSYDDCGTNLGQGRHIRDLNVKSTGALLSGKWGVRRLVVETGGTLGSTVDFEFTSSALYDNTTPGQTTIRQVLPGGITYPRNVMMGPQYGGNSANKTHEWRLDGGGDLTVNGSLTIAQATSACHGTEVGVLILEDNAGGTPRNLYVGGALNIGHQGTGSTKAGLFKTASGVHTVVGTLKLGCTGSRTSASYTKGNGAMQLGSSTVYVGGNYEVRRSIDANRGVEFIDANWDEGTSTIIFNGTGTQTLYTEGMPLYNVEINKPSGTLTLSNELLGGAWRNPLLLKGDFTLTAVGTFNQNNVPIIFNGPEHNFTDLVGKNFDNIELLANAVVILQSNVNIGAPDNLIMGQDSVIWLNGHQLIADGITYVDGAQAVWTNDLGEIRSGLIPEPGTMLLLGTGALAVVGYLRRRRMK